MVIGGPSGCEILAIERFDISWLSGACLLQWNISILSAQWFLDSTPQYRICSNRCRITSERLYVTSNHGESQLPSRVLSVSLFCLPFKPNQSLSGARGSACQSYLLEEWSISPLSLYATKMVHLPSPVWPFGARLFVLSMASLSVQLIYALK